MRTRAPGNDGVPVARSRRGLARLAEQIRAIETGRAPGDSRARRVVRTGWPVVDNDLLPGGLACGAVHEWLGVAEPGAEATGLRPQCGRAHWLPPLCILAHLAWRAGGRGEGMGGEATERRSDEATKGGKEGIGPPGPSGGGGWVFWIGRRVWPYPHLLAGLEPYRPAGGKTRRRTKSAPRQENREFPDSSSGGAYGGVLARSIFVDPPDDATRLWAIDLALRSSAVSAVVADGRRLHMAATRRLQLAAEAGNALGLLARPADEHTRLSAAATRWLVQLAPPSDTGQCRHPRWQVVLMRRKGRSDGATERRSDEGEEGAIAGVCRGRANALYASPGFRADHQSPIKEQNRDPPPPPSSLLLEFTHAAGVVALSPEMAGGPDPAADAQRSQRRTA